MTIQALAYPVFDPGGAKAVKTTNTVKVIQTEGMHDTAVITLRGVSMDAPELQPGTPVQMQFGWANIDTDWFYGYVDHTQTHYDRAITDPSTFEDVICLGASYTLKDPFVGAWTDTQASTLVKTVANQYYLSTIVESDDPVWPQLSSPGSSAWSFLIQLANKVGYRLACNKTQVRFKSADTALRRHWMTMPVFKTRKTAPAYLAQGITRFQALTGEDLTVNGGTKASRFINGMNLRSGEIVGASNDGTNIIPMGQRIIYPFFSEQVSEVAPDLGTAQAVLQGKAQANRFAYQATATLTGMTIVNQSTPVVLTGIDSVNDGVWWVQEVTHKISANGYSMDVCLGRDSKGDSGMRPTQDSSVTFSPQNPFGYTIANVPPTTLVNNRWRAAYQSNVDLS